MFNLRLPQRLKPARVPPLPRRRPPGLVAVVVGLVVVVVVVDDAADAVVALEGRGPPPVEGERAVRVRGPVGPAVEQALEVGVLAALGLDLDGQRVAPRRGDVVRREAPRAPAWKSNLQPDFSVRVCDRFDARLSAVLRELNESNRFVQKSDESTSI